MKPFATKKNLELFNVASKESGVDEHNISGWLPYIISQVESNLSFNLLI